MTLTIATWNINSVRLRVELVGRLLKEEAPDILCLQECKCETARFPAARFRDFGYPHQVVSGQKSYNGVAIVSRLPLEKPFSFDPAGLGQARHVGAHIGTGSMALALHGFYVPAGGDIPDRDLNPKFGDKLDFLKWLREQYDASAPRRSILVGDLNIAPRADDVWNHRQLINVVSHTQIEVAHLEAVQRAGHWVDIVRKDIPEGRLYSWWSYRARDWGAADKGRRLDHIWATPDLAAGAHSSRILRHVRGWERGSDHAPVFATFNL